MKQPARVAIIAAGGWVKRRIMPTLQAIEGVTLASVCNRRRETAEAVAREFGIARVHDNWLDAVTAEDVDAVYVGGWPFLHERVTLAALAAGKHVLVEAHMAGNAGEAKAMLDAANARPHLISQVVTVGRLLKAERTVRRLISDGYLGALHAIDLHVSEGFVDPEQPLPRRFDRDLSGQNWLYVGVWYEELMRWVGEATRLMAAARTCYPTRRDEAGNRIAMAMPDQLSILAHFACGAQAVMQFSAVAGFPGPSGVRLAGSDGTLYFNQSTQTLCGASRGDTELSEVLIPPDQQDQWRVTENWIAAIRGEEEVRYTTFADGYRYMAFTDAVVRSAEARQSVAVEA
jgi:predicted dehydrogenase